MRYGNCQLLDLVPTISTTQYTSGDVVGGLLDFGALIAVNNRGVLKSLLVLDADNQKAALTLLLFASKPAGTFTDNSALALSAADLALVTAKVDVAPTDYETFDSKALAQIDVATVLASLNSDRHLYGVLVTTGTPTFTDTDRLKLRAGVLND